MDSGEEDVSARVLLRNVLQAELPRSPVTRSVSRVMATSRRSARMQSAATALTSPQLTLRIKQKQRLHENASRSPLPPSKRRSLSSLVRKVKTPASALPTLYDDITPRGLLRGIIQTESDTSLLISAQSKMQEAEPASIEYSLHGNRQSEVGVCEDLPELLTEPLSEAVRGLSRRRPPPCFNISTFERQLDIQPGENSDVIQDAESGSALSVTLKTPFVDVCSGRAGLQRKAANRRQPCVEAFDEAVQNRLERGRDPELSQTIGQQEGRTLGDSDWQRFTLGLSNVTVPDITSDTMSNTKLYAQPISMATQLSKDEEGGREGEMEEGEREEEGEVEEREGEMPQTQEVELEPQTEEGEELESHTQEGEELMPQTEEGEELEPYTPEGEELEPQTSEGEEFVPQTREGEELVNESRGAGDSHEDEVTSQPSERISRRAYRSEGGAKVPGVTAGGRGYKSLGAGLQPTERDLESAVAGTTQSLGEWHSGNQEGEFVPQTQEGEELVNEWRGVEDSQEEEVTSQPSELTSRRAYRSEGGAKVPGVTAGGRGYKSLGAGLQPTERDLESAVAGTTQSLGEWCSANQEGEGFVPQTQEGEELVNEWRGAEDSQEEEVTSQPSERIRHRAYRSEGGAKVPGVTAGGRGYKSLGAGLQPTERDLETTLARTTPSLGDGHSGEQEEGKSPTSIHQDTPFRHSDHAPTSIHQDTPLRHSDHASTHKTTPLVSIRHTSMHQATPPTPSGSVGVWLMEEGVNQPHEDLMTSDPVLSPASLRHAPEDEEEDEDDDDDDDDDRSVELSMETPAFIRNRRDMLTPTALATPTVLRAVNAGPSPKVVKTRKRQDGPAPQGHASSRSRALPAPQGHASSRSRALPKTYVMNVFKHFTKTRVAADVYPVLTEILQKYFDRLADDLAAFAAHAKRRTIEVEDVELLMRRQGFVTDSSQVNVLIEKHLPLEYRKLLIPVATSGNTVIPKQRR